MEPSDLQKLIRDCPLLIRMNAVASSSSRRANSSQWANYTAGILVKDDDGVRRNAIISLINNASVLPHASPPKRRPRRKSS
jgi:hypothetical protein